MGRQFNTDNVSLNQHFFFFVTVECLGEKQAQWKLHSLMTSIISVGKKFHTDVGMGNKSSLQLAELYIGL